MIFLYKFPKKIEFKTVNHTIYLCAVNHTNMFKTNTHIILTDFFTSDYRVAYIVGISNDILTVFYIAPGPWDNTYITVPSTCPHIKSLEHIHLSPVIDQKTLIEYYVSNILKNVYNIIFFEINYISENIIIQKKCKVTEDVVYKDIGDIITEFAKPHYYIKYIEGWCRKIDTMESHKFNVSNICINNFIYNQSTEPFKQIAKLIHDQCILEETLFYSC